MEHSTILTPSPAIVIQLGICMLFDSCPLSLHIMVVSIKDNMEYLHHKSRKSLQLMAPRLEMAKSTPMRGVSRRYPERVLGLYAQGHIMGTFSPYLQKKTFVCEVL